MRGFRQWRWRLDEMYLKPNGEMVYLWRKLFRRLAHQPFLSGVRVSGNPRAVHFDLADSLHQLKPHVTPATAVVTLQNGIDAPDEVFRQLPGSKIVAGRVHGFFEMDGHTVRHRGVRPSVRFGCVSGDFSDVHQQVADVVSDAGFSPELSNNIMQDLWEKLLLGSPLGGVGAALNLPAGQVIEHPRGNTMLRDAMVEISHLAHACGITLGQAEIERTFEFVRLFPRHATTSLQRDLEARRPSEFGALIAGIIARARQKGVSMPTFEEVHNEICLRYFSA